MTNIIDIRKPPDRDALDKFVFDTEEDFRAISLLSGAIQRLMAVPNEDGPIWILAREIDEHLKRIQAYLD